MIIFGEEISELEESISIEYSLLREEARRKSPSPSIIHRSLRKILQDCAILSLVFFPPGDASTAKRRALMLRERFLVDEHSIIAFRAARNHLAHLDDRLDKWSRSSENRTFGRAMIGSISDVERVGINREDVLGLFDISNFEYYFTDDNVNIENLVSEVRRVGHLARSLNSELKWN